jgi:hypothetical protein
MPTAEQTEERRLTQLSSLRMSLAGVANAMGLGHEVPGGPHEGLQSLHEATISIDRGWDRLAALCVDRSQGLMETHQGAQEALCVLRRHTHTIYGE